MDTTKGTAPKDRYLRRAVLQQIMFATQVAVQNKHNGHGQLVVTRTEQMHNIQLSQSFSVNNCTSEHNVPKKKPCLAFLDWLSCQQRYKSEAHRAPSSYATLTTCTVCMYVQLKIATKRMLYGEPPRLAKQLCPPSLGVPAEGDCCVIVSPVFPWHAQKRVMLK